MGAQLAAARLLYGMGRNDALPKRIFGFIDPTRHIPRNNVLIVGGSASLGAFLVSYERGAELLNFRAFIAFMGVNAALFVRYVVREKQRHLAASLVPVVGFITCAFIWWNLSVPAKIAGSIWLTVGIAYGAIKTRGFRAS